jgi:alpha-1,2-mannosyltransferase
MAVACSTRTSGSEGQSRLWPYAAAVLSMALFGIYLELWGNRYGLDLKVYRNSVGSWRSGANPYLRTFTASRLSFTYPPFALLALTPFAWTSFHAMQWMLSAASVAVATAAVVVVLRDRGVQMTPRLWCASLSWSCVSAVILEPSRSEINYGQIEFLLMALVLVDLLLVPAPYRGLLTGLCAAIKLTPLIYVLFFIAEPDIRSALRAVLSFSSCGLATWLLWPRLSQEYWLHDITNPARIGGITYNGNQSWYAILHRLPFSNIPHILSWWLALSLVMLITSVLVARRFIRLGERGFAILAIALAGLLSSPISWTHHWIWILIIPPLLLHRPHAAMTWSTQVLLWGFVAIAVLAPYWWFSDGGPSDLGNMILPLWATAALVAWSASEVKRYIHPRHERERVERAPTYLAEG